MKTIALLALSIALIVPSPSADACKPRHPKTPTFKIDKPCCVQKPAITGISRQWRPTKWPAPSTLVQYGPTEWEDIYYNPDENTK